MRLNESGNQVVNMITLKQLLVLNCRISYLKNSAVTSLISTGAGEAKGTWNRFYIMSRIVNKECAEMVRMEHLTQHQLWAGS